VAAMRPELRHEVWHALTAPVATKPGRRYLRPTLIGLVLAGAAAAALFALGPGVDENDGAAFTRSSRVAAPTEIEAAPGSSTAIPSFPNTVDGQAASDRVAGASDGRERLVVLAIRHDNLNPETIDDLN